MKLTKARLRTPRLLVFFFFLNFLFAFATLKIVWFFFFSFTKLLPQRQGPVVGQTLGELLAQHGGSGGDCLEINVFPVGLGTLISQLCLPAPSPVQVVLAFWL